VTPAGWYVDPGNESRLRWWSGLDWTEHVAPLPDHQPEPDARPGHAHDLSVEREDLSDSTPPAEEAETTPSLTRRERRLLEDEAAATRALPPPVSHIAPITSYAWQPEANHADDRANPAMPLIELKEPVLYRDIASRWSSASVWVIAFVPWVTVLFLAAAALLTVWGSACWLPVGSLVLPTLLTVAAAQRDAKRLRSWGHRSVAHWAWSLLGHLAYLIARTIVLRRHAGLGSAPLWAGVVNVLLVTVSSALLVGATAATWSAAGESLESDMATALESTYGTVQVQCPPIDSMTVECEMTDAAGLTRVIAVEVSPTGDTFTYSIRE
jgi:hypothetical protein